MNKKRILATLSIVLLFAVVLVGVVSADDGQMFRKNVSKTPDQETERANLMQMIFYVPAQTSNGEPTAIEYYDAAGTLVETRDNAKPLVAVYIDSLTEEHEEPLSSIFSGAGFGAHDAYAALSLDDGTTWKRTNLSNSADLSSFVLADGHEYPGDAHNMTFAIAGDKVLVGWISKYCDGGSPAYTWLDEEGNDLYPDIWGVGGTQISVDYTLMGFPEVGEIPYSCVWTARGQLLPIDGDPENGYDIVWTKAERLTSGRRDANRLEMNGDSAAGFMMTWQEDPEGLRPGQGLGPGEGWSGAVVNQQTDLWYSYISVEDFILVDDDSDYTNGIVSTPLDEFILGETEFIPKVAIPLALPVRLTDNKMCKAENDLPYCYINFDDVDAEGNLILPDDLDSIEQTSDSTFCFDTVTWTTPGSTGGDNPKDLILCKAKDGRVLGGRVGASRPRVNVQPYDADGDWVYDNAWVIMGAEESKALGEGATEDVEPEDVGKNMWYYTFDMLNPDVVQQGLMINQPAKCSPYDALVSDCTQDEFMEVEDPLYIENIFYSTEIARRFSHFSQPSHQIGDSGVSAVLIVKQGIINQGGPADIFLRRLVVPNDDWLDCDTDEEVTVTTVERCLPAGYNPYAYDNLACDEWAFTDRTNPRYLEGLCLDNMINISGVTWTECDGDCDAFPWVNFDANPDNNTVGDFPKVTVWSQDGPDYGVEVTSDNIGNLDDQSWENPYDVAKGHRGFIDGDFIMMMYAWSPNWRANSVGNDHYNLYARRSFDGGVTWTTTPESWNPEELTDVNFDIDGSTFCENYKLADGTISSDCNDYAVGAFEPARNLSQLIGNKETILDPRYTPTGGIKMLPVNIEITGINPEYFDDIRDPSKFFIVYETGDNTTVAEGEAVPLDLFYSRATNWGDDYDLVDYTVPDGPDLDSDPDLVQGFDWLEHDRDDLSGEAANLANPGGTLYYAIWNQWQEDEYENVSESDAIFRRILYLDDGTDDDGDGTGDNEDAAPIATILYVSDMMPHVDDQLLVIGTARDGDHVGDLPADDIGEYEWTDTYMGITQVFEDDDGDPKRLNIPVRNLHPGWHGIGFKASDKGGHWSNSVSVNILVTDGTNVVFLPVAIP